jgi:hypothetical protein
MSAPPKLAKKPDQTLQQEFKPNTGSNLKSSDNQHFHTPPQTYTQPAVVQSSHSQPQLAPHNIHQHPVPFSNHSNTYYPRQQQPHHFNHRSPYPTQGNPSQKHQGPTGMPNHSYPKPSQKMPPTPNAVPHMIHPANLQMGWQGTYPMGVCITLVTLFCLTNNYTSFNMVMNFHLAPPYLLVKSLTMLPEFQWVSNPT